MDNSTTHITVCICTYKRPALLDRLLQELSRQDTKGLFVYSIVVADNDAHESARNVVTRFAGTSPAEVTYCVEPQQNIALARNRAIANASGDYIAFIDDDEFPAKGWLLSLFKTCNECKADGVLGPVKPHFENEPPRWIKKGRFFERPTHDTGFTIDWTTGRTGNLLFKRRILEGMGEAFKPEFGSGGEDRHFFKWCNEAVAYETVPPIRWKRSFMLKRALLRGKVSLVDPSSRMLKVAKSAMAIPAYTLALPFLLVMGQHRFMKYLVKTFDHLGRILTFLGIDVVKEKYVTE
jgi:succinoglycan biosynthesis protein ExoM